jgi:hypothetical protein
MCNVVMIPQTRRKSETKTFRSRCLTDKCIHFFGAHSWMRSMRWPCKMMTNYARRWLIMLVGERSWMLSRNSYYHKPCSIVSRAKCGASLRYHSVRATASPVLQHQRYCRSRTPLGSYLPVILSADRLCHFSTPTVVYSWYILLLDSH